MDGWLVERMMEMMGWFSEHIVDIRDNKIMAIFLSAIHFMG